MGCIGLESLRFVADLGNTRKAVPKRPEDNIRMKSNGVVMDEDVGGEKKLGEG